jgi:2-phospho-L-lactate transferase/gluconeogenesis factor (CofD/UPF0052 family)
VVDEIRSAVIATRARRVYVCNLRAESAETKGYDVADHVTALRDHGLEVDAVVVDPSSQVRAGPLSGPERIVQAEVAEPGAAVHDPRRLASVLAGLLP